MRYQKEKKSPWAKSKKLEVENTRFQVCEVIGLTPAVSEGEGEVGADWQSVSLHMRM